MKLFSEWERVVLRARRSFPGTCTSYPILNGDFTWEVGQSVRQETMISGNGVVLSRSGKLWPVRESLLFTCMCYCFLSGVFT